MTEIKDPIDVRISRLGNYLIRAHKNNKASILFALYLSEYVRTDVEKEIKQLLNEHGLEALNVDAGEHKDLPSFFSSGSSGQTVFFVHNMEKGFPDALRYLNFKREDIIDHQVKAVFWVTEKELTCIGNEAPDFFAFRNRVIEFIEVSLAEESKPALVEFAPETEYKSLDEIKRSIELKESLLLELSKDDEISGYLMGSLGILYNQIGSYKKAIKYHKKALVISREIGDKRGEGKRLGNLGNAYLNLGKVKKAIKYYQNALVISKEIGDRQEEGARLVTLGNAYFILGQVEKAIEYYQNALVIAKEIGDRRGEGNAIGNLGNVCRYLGHVEKAMEYYQKTLVIAREIGDRRNEGIWLGNLGIAYRNQGQVKKAIECYEQALDIGKEIKDLKIINFCEENIESLQS
jgi:tetratricopeptide (TPR) repeat protein